MRESKECAECGGIYFRPEGYTAEQWEARKYCSASCAGKGTTRRNREKKEASQVSQVIEPVVGESSEQASQVSEPSERAPVMRDLRIVRVGPNPKLLVCEYYELAQRRICTVLVRKTDKFVRGMRFAMAEPAHEADFIRPWPYTGPPPRHRGRW